MLFNLFLVLCCIATAAVLAVLVIRCVGGKRLKFGQIRLSLAKPLALAGETVTKKDSAKVALWALGILFITYGASLLYSGIFKDGVSWQSFCNAWQHYDVIHYLRLAELGYFGNVENGQHLTLVFFPLYPWLMRLLHLLIPNYALCGHIISSLCYIGSCCVFFRLVTEEFGKKMGWLSVAFLTAYPFSFFFASIHTESLFLLLSVACFYMIRKHRYPLAGVLGALAALTRMQGVLLAVVAFAEYCMSEHPIRKIQNRDVRGLWQDFYGKLIWMGLIGLGTLAYLLLNYAVEGDPFRFLVYQKEHWNQGTQLFVRSLRGLWGALWNPSQGYEFVSFTTWGPQIVLFAFCLIFLLYGVRRLHPVWMIYFVICVYLNFSLTNPLSCGRYIACAFPLPVLLAMGSQKRPALGHFMLTAFGILQGIFMLAYFAGRHVC